MRALMLLPPIVGALFLLMLPANGQVADVPARDQPSFSESAVGPSSDPVERGSYLVHHVAMCVQCHSPRDRFGALQRDRLLSGASVPVQSPYTGPRWAFTAPNLVRAPGYTREQFVKLLTEGVTRQGQTPRAPMPPFRMTTTDAEAVWAYLRSL